MRGADQLELVGLAPEAPRRRMARGDILPAGEVDAALARYYRMGNLNALRELALLRPADRVDDTLRAYRSEHLIGGVREAFGMASAELMDSAELATPGSGLTVVISLPCVRLETSCAGGATRAAR